MSTFDKEKFKADKIYSIVDWEDMQKTLEHVETFFIDHNNTVEQQHGGDYNKRVARCVKFLQDVARHTYDQKTLNNEKVA